MPAGSGSFGATMVATVVRTPRPRPFVTTAVPVSLGASWFAGSSLGTVVLAGPGMPFAAVTMLVLVGGGR